MKSEKKDNLIVLTVLALLFNSLLFSQSTNIDSLKTVLNKTGDKKIKSEISLYIGTIYYKQSNILEAQDYWHKSLKFSEEANDKKGKAEALNNIGIIYNRNGNLLKCIELLEQSLQLRLELKDQHGLALAYNNLGFFYFTKKDTVKALEYCKIALKMQETIGDKEGLGYTLMNIGNQFKSKGEYNKAKQYYERSLQLREQIKSEQGIAETLTGLGQLALDGNNLKAALTYALQSYKLSKELGYPVHLKNSSELLYKIYKKNGKVHEALQMYELYTGIKDTINKEKNRKSFLQKEFQLAYEKKAAADSVKAIEVKKIEQIRYEQEASKQKTYTYAGIGGFIFMLVVAAISFKAFKQKQKDNHLIFHQKKLVESKQKEIIDSINYAKKIQDTLLVHTDLLDASLSEYFILYKPKDIVSGDFYWAAKTISGSKFMVPGSAVPNKEHETENKKHEAENKELFYLAVCDSTGHGVPGAFMSLLNISFINEAINEKDISEPNKIFEYVRERLINSVSRDGQQDGFDGILLCIDKANKKMKYSAANNRPMFIQNNKIINLSHDKMPVGKGDRKESFNIYEIDLIPGDTMYLYTDGFADQFGGSEGKKFKSKKLIELLTSVYGFPLSRQKEILNEKFEEWKGSLEQVDDVCIIGIKI